LIERILIVIYIIRDYLGIELIKSINPDKAVEYRVTLKTAILSTENQHWVNW